MGLDLAKALVAALVSWPPDVELLVAGLAPPGVGWALAAVKDWALAVVKDWGLGVAKACRQALLPGCV